MKEDKNSVIPMMVKDSDDPCVYNSGTEQFEEFHPVMIDRDRMVHALNSGRICAPQGMSSSEKLSFILNTSVYPT